MKLNWGNWIAAVYIIFVLFIGALVYLSFGEKWDLVTENYYEEEIKYQDKINSKSNVKQGGLKPEIFIEKGSINLRFPGTDQALDQFSGQLTFFRPSNAEMDITFDFQNSNELKFPLNPLSRGKYLAKLSWTDGEKGYYHEEYLIIP